MATEDLPNPGSFNDFRVEIEAHDYEKSEEWFVEMYTCVLAGTGRAIAAERHTTLPKLHNPDYQERWQFRLSSLSMAA